MIRKHMNVGEKQFLSDEEFSKDLHVRVADVRRRVRLTSLPNSFSSLMNIRRTKIRLLTTVEK
jgi:hypothetical protein